MQIKELKIYSSHLKEQTHFYTNVLGLTVVKHTEKNVVFQMGKSMLNIEYKPKTTPYHLAINIPSNKEIEALHWVKSKVDILMNGSQEIQDFEFWNAKAIYFYDSDQNIVELIARKNLNNSIEQKFDTDQLIEISEIGLPTKDIEKEFIQLNNSTGIEIYDGDFDRFCAIGDENGLFICINKTIKDWFPTNDKAFSSDFEIKLTEKGKTYQIAYKNEKIQMIEG